MDKRRNYADPNGEEEVWGKKNIKAIFVILLLIKFVLRKR